MRFGALGKVDEGALPRKGEINDGSFSFFLSFSLSLLLLVLCATHLNIRCDREEELGHSLKLRQSRTQNLPYLFFVFAFAADSTVHKIL